MKRFVFLGVLLLLTLRWNLLQGQHFIMADGQTVTTCNGTFYDPGGLDEDYEGNTDITQTFFSQDPDKCLQVIFHYIHLEECYGDESLEEGVDFPDYLKVYDGPDIYSPLIGTYGGDLESIVITSTSGSLTFEFHSDGWGNYEGWEAEINCVLCPPPSANLNMHNGTVTVDCSQEQLFYDPRGPNRNYDNCSYFKQTFVASDTEKCLSVSFISFYLEDFYVDEDLDEYYYDYLEVFDGTTTSSPLIGRYAGNVIPSDIVSTSGALTFVFRSDESGNDAGWEAVVSCVDCGGTPLPPESDENMHNGTDTIHCSQSPRLFYDPGGTDEDYGSNSDYTQTFVASDSNMCLTVSFNTFRLESPYNCEGSFCDYLEIYDGPTTSSPLVGVFSGTSSPGRIGSVSGALTFVFHSDEWLNYAGWSAEISCEECPSVDNNMHDGTDTIYCGQFARPFYDPGGPERNYGNHSSYTQTFVVSQPQKCLEATFTNFITEYYDTLFVYDGNSSSSPLIGAYFGSSNPGVITSSSGFMTFVFHSDSSINRAGWEAAVGCVECPPPIPDFTTHVYLCPDSSAVLAAPNGYSYYWSTGDTTPNITVSAPGTYTVTSVSASGSSLSLFLVSRMLANPINHISIPNMCAGDSYNITVGHDSLDNVSITTHEFVQVWSDTVFLPDGEYCEPYGCSYRSPLHFTNFIDNDVITSVEDILYVRLNMEHSYAADLYINITCPNGQNADILRFNGNTHNDCSSEIPASSVGWQVGYNVQGLTDFGLANQTGDWSATSGCNSENNPPGVGWNYCWSNNSTHGFQYSSAGDGLIYRTGNAHDGRFDSSNVASGEQFYHPDQSFQSLVGCPLNGTWYIEVIDGSRYNNGYLFEWELALSEDIETVEYADFTGVTLEGPWVTTIVSDSSFLISPPVDLPSDTAVSYTFHCYSASGCDYDTTVSILFYGNQLRIVDTVVCDSLLWDGVIYRESGEYLFTHQDSVTGCESMTVLRIVVPEDPIVDAHLSEMLAGGSQMVTFGQSEEDNLQYIVPQTTMSQSDTVFLPDGTDCGNGCSYQASLTFSDFADTSVIRSGEEIRFVRLNMEHSFIKDLYINLVCPNGQHATILKKNRNDGESTCLSHIPLSGRGWQSGNNVNEAFLGWAYDDSDNSSLESLCDVASSRNAPGQGWDYCWSNNTTEGFQYAGDDGLVYRFVNTTQYHTIFGDKRIVNPSDVETGTQFYHPDDPFDSLVGCPLNGTWTVEVMDGLKLDNGYLFTWEISFDDRLIPHHYASVSFDDFEGPWITRLTDTSFVITPPDTLRDTLVSYTFTVSDSNGCSFTTIQYMQIYAHRYTDLFDTIYADALATYSWHDLTFTQAGSQSDTIYLYLGPDSVKVDSVVTMHLSVIYPLHDMICRNDLPWEWCGLMFDTADTQVVSYPVDGADSILVLNLQVNVETNSLLTDTVLENNLPYVLNGNSYDSTSVYTQLLTNVVGCDSVLTLNLTVIYNKETSIDTVVCEHELPYIWRGLRFDAVGTQYDTLTGHFGEDSVLVLTLTTIPTTYDTITDILLENDDYYVLNGERYDSAGTYTQHLINSEGCDSVLTLNLTVIYNKETSIDTAVCDHELPYTWRGLPFDSAGTQFDTLTGRFGEDSVLVLTLTTIPTTYGTVTDTMLENEGFYVLNGERYDSAGVYTQHLTNVAGCDSILTLNLTVIYNEETWIDTMVCDHELPYIWRGLLFDTAGTRYDTLMAVLGEDSVLVLTLTTIPTTYDTIMDILLENDVYYVLNGERYDSAGIYTQQLTNAAGCDSVLTLILTMIYNKEILIDTAVCDHELPYLWRGLQFDTTGTQFDTLSGHFGEDSVLVLTLTTLPTTYGSVADTVLENNLPYALNSDFYDSAGSYTQQLTNAKGCDSVLTLNLTVIYNKETSIDTAVCEQELPYTWHGLQFDSVGTRFDTLTASMGEDSVLVLTLTTLPTTYDTITDILLENDVYYELNGEYYDSAGIYTQQLTNVAGCDSLLTINLTMIYNTETLIDTAVCHYELPFTWRGLQFDSVGTLYDTLSGHYGEDSVLVLTLTTIATTYGSEAYTVLENNLPYSLNGMLYDSAGVYTQQLTSVAGCDSVLTLELTVLYNVVATADSTICTNEVPFVWNGVTFLEAGRQSVTLQAVNGVDSTLIMNVYLLPVPEVNISGIPMICNGEPAFLTADSAVSYLWSTGDTTQSILAAVPGAYQVTIWDELGCTNNTSVQVLSTFMNPISDVLIPEMCAGDTFLFTIGHQSSSNIVIGEMETTLSLSEKVFLPDGEPCGSQDCSYRSPLTFSAYMDDAVVTSVNDILYVRLNLEHSYAGDLYINLTCPNGQKADILRFDGSSTATCSASIPMSSRGWQNGNNANLGTHFGQAFNQSDNIHPCDSTTPGNTPGIGWNYCWSNNTSQGYTYASGVGSLIYRASNAHNYGSFFNPLRIFDSSNVAAGTQFYHPDQSFQSLVGCPLNGSWYIEVMDGFSRDNGYIFGWELALTPEILTVDYSDVTNATVEGLWVNPMSDTTFLITPPATLSHDTTVYYRFYLYDDYGCSYDTLLPITFHVADTVFTDTTTCDSYTWNNVTYTESGRYLQTFTNQFGCDSTVVLNLTVFTSPEARISGPATICPDASVLLVVDSCDQYLWNTGDTSLSIIVSEAGTYQVTVTNADGCSASADFVLEMPANPIVSISEPVVCGNSAYPVTMGIGLDNTLVLNQNPNMFTLEVQGPWLTVNTQGVPTVVPPAELARDTTLQYACLLTDTNGCLFDATVLMTVYPLVNNTIDTSACDSFTYHDSTYTESGTYSHIFTASSGCDSTVTLLLTLYHSSALTYDTLWLVENDLPYHFEPTGITFVVPETLSFQYTLENQDGCDSVIQQQVYINANVTRVFDTTVCALPLTWHGHLFTAAGSVTDSLKTVHNSDSLLTYTVNVDVLGTAIGNVSHIVCYGASTGAATASVTGGQSPLNYQWKDNTGSAVSVTLQLSDAVAGRYSFTVTDSLGCHASDTLTLRNLHDELVPGTIAESQSVCEGEVLAGFTGDAASGGDNGGYQWQISNDANTWTEAPGIANTQNYTYPGVPPVTSFLLRRVWVTESCGFAHSNTVEVTIWPNYHDTLSAAVCQGDVYMENGFEIDETMTAHPGIFEFEQRLSTDHCDSVIVLQLVVNQRYENNIEDEVCEGESYFANGFAISAMETQNADTLHRTLTIPTGQGCDSVVHLHLVVVDTSLQIISMTPDFCEEMSAELMVVTEMSDYQWSTGEMMPQITVTSPGVYSVTAEQGGCRSTAKYVIEPCELQITLPNAITPSRGDGLNDYFSIPEPMQRSIQEFEISIFNRWGEQIFYSTDKYFRWNGEVNGKIYYNNVYTYMIRCTNAIGKPYVFKGSVTVL